ncbi:hypothetical protein IJ541_04070 [bacterium]|nr:hypothetical protein [bacterium]
MTIPSLIQENQKRATVTKLQKGISVINQAYKLSFDEQGEPDSAFNMGAEVYFKQYWQPYLKVVTYCDLYSTCGYKSNQPFKQANGRNFGTNIINRYRTTFYTADGLLFIIFIGASNNEGINIPSDMIWLDINGGELPNKFGRDVFILKRIEDGLGVRPIGDTLINEEIEQECQEKGYYCAEKIRRAGWKIEKDYPW